MKLICPQLMGSKAAAATECAMMVNQSITCSGGCSLFTYYDCQYVGSLTEYVEPLHLEPDLTPLSSGSILMLCRNPTLNPKDFFDKEFEEYKNGFAANGISSHNC